MDGSIRPNTDIFDTVTLVTVFWIGKTKCTV